MQILYKNSVSCDNVEMHSQRKQNELDKRAYDDLLKERDILSKVHLFWSKNINFTYNNRI